MSNIYRGGVWEPVCVGLVAFACICAALFTCVFGGFAYTQSSAVFTFLYGCASALNAVWAFFLCSSLLPVLRIMSLEDFDTMLAVMRHGFFFPYLFLAPLLFANAFVLVMSTTLLVFHLSNAFVGCVLAGVAVAALFAEYRLSLVYPEV